MFIVVKQSSWELSNFYAALFYFQMLCYLIAALGWYFENRKIRVKLFFVPYYFVMINYASVKGLARYFKGSQSVNWEKAKRA